jgi:hypothetical protein
MRTEDRPRDPDSDREALKAWPVQTGLAQSSTSKVIAEMWPMLGAGLLTGIGEAAGLHLLAVAAGIVGLLTTPTGRSGLRSFLLWAVSKLEQLEA